MQLTIKTNKMKDTFDNDLYDYLNEEEEDNGCANCGVPTDKTYCSNGCKIEHNN